MGNSAKRKDPLWLRLVIAFVLSAALGLLALLFTLDALGGAALPVAGGITLVCTVLMAAKAKRIGQIASWFFDLLSGI